MQHEEIEPPLRTRRMGRQSEETAQRTREDIVVAALHVFAEQGFEAAGLRDIAQEAHTTHGLIHHYFGSKERVWLAVVDFVIQRFVQALQPHIQQGMQRQEEPLEATRQGIRNFLLVFAQYPEMAQLMLHEGVRGGTRFDYVIEQLEQMNATMGPLFTRVQELGYLRQFNNQNFFLYLLTAGAAPIGLRALSQHFIGADILSDEQVLQHIDRLLALLFPAC